MKGIELLANIVRGELPGWYAKPEHCSHMFNYGGVWGDSEMPRCAVCNKTKTELDQDKQ